MAQEWQVISEDFQFDRNRDVRFEDLLEMLLHNLLSHLRISKISYVVFSNWTEMRLVGEPVWFAHHTFTISSIDFCWCDKKIAFLHRATLV